MVTASVTLRELLESDLEFLSEVRHDQSTLPYLHNPAKFSMEQVRSWYLSERPNWLIIEHLGTQVGYVRVSDPEPIAKTIKVGIDMHPLYRRRGFAFAAYQILLEDIREQGWKTAWLEVLATNQPARALYEKLGFQYCGSKNRKSEKGVSSVWSLSMAKIL